MASNTTLYRYRTDAKFNVLVQGMLSLVRPGPSQVSLSDIESAAMLAVELVAEQEIVRQAFSTGPLFMAEPETPGIVKRPDVLSGDWELTIDFRSRKTNGVYQVKRRGKTDATYIPESILADDAAFAVRDLRRAVEKEEGGI